MGRRNVKSNIAGAHRPPEPERYALIKEAGGREMITDEELGKGLLRLKLIWFGMLGSLAIYLFIGLQIATSPQASMNESTFAVLKTVLYIITTVLLVITKYIRKHILSGKGQHRQATQSFQHPDAAGIHLPLHLARRLAGVLGQSLRAAQSGQRLPWFPPRHAPGDARR